MGTIDLTTLTLDELKELRDRANRLIEERIAEAIAKEREGREQHVCPDRANGLPGMIKTVGPTDYWDKQPNGDRTCSWCGSLHPDDFMGKLESSLVEGSDVTVEDSTKGYKFYVRQPTNGGIKFYTWHIPNREWADKANALYVKRKQTVFSLATGKQETRGG